MPGDKSMNDEAWGITQVKLFTGLSRVTIWRLCKRKMFPQPHYLLRDRKWWKSEIVKWVADQTAKAKPSSSRRRPGDKWTMTRDAQLRRVVTCSCGEHYSLDLWVKLPLAGRRVELVKFDETALCEALGIDFMGEGDPPVVLMLEMRNCKCGSTITMEWVAK